MADQQTEKFEGWAVVELYGHNKEAGFVTTRYFGTGALFQIDVPELPEREIELSRPEYVNGSLAPAGSKVKRGAVEARSRLVGPGAIYALNPCTEGVVRKLLEDMAPRPIAIVSLPDGKQLLPGEEEDDGPYEDDFL